MDAGISCLPNAQVSAAVVALRQSVAAVQFEEAGRDTEGAAYGIGGSVAEAVFQLVNLTS